MSTKSTFPRKAISSDKPKTNEPASTKMPHATGSEVVESEDEDFNNVMRQMNAPTNEASFDFLQRELEPGEKADDAVDYEDIDDDDLPDEELGFSNLENGDGKKASIQDDWSAMEGMEGILTAGALDQHPVGDELDDLFGDVPSSPVGGHADQNDELPPIGSEAISSLDVLDVASPTKENDTTEVARGMDRGSVMAPTDMDAATFKEYQLQQALFAMSSYGPDNPPAPPENHEELLASLWPKFDRNAMPRFLELLPPKKSHFAGKSPLKPPKRIVPTKLNLELAQDQERAFRTTGQTLKRALDLENTSIVVITPPAEATGGSSGSMDIDGDLDEELPGGITMQDLQFICADWDIKTPVTDSEEEEMKTVVEVKPNEQPGAEDDDWLFETNRPTKKRRLDKSPADYISSMPIDMPLFDDPVSETARLAKKIQIDLNDPYLLLDERPSEAALQAPKRLGTVNRDEIAGSFTKRLIKRYNISNDDAYDMLKENHQNKVRSTLGSVALEHSLPAVRLQWPYYKTKLARQEARSFHRPSLSFYPNLPISFKKPLHIKRKHQKGKDVKTLYTSTKSLSLSDNSNVLLLEYSEEHPTMMSNFGMGSRLINYYRRKNMEDPARPKAEIGETAVLLPQDKSPFSIFGHIDPGETSAAITTAMFRAPVFQQEPKPTDFLVIRNSTGIDGSSYYIRNIENLYVVGQQFPSVDVPGPHSRKVTTASKNRLKMICYRLLKRNKKHRVSVADITEHFPESSDMQNRQKMKEFLQFSKDHKEWEMKPGDPIPDEDVLRGYVKPEDICLLEAMQVGQQHLHDAGYDRDEDDADDDEKEGESSEQQLAPWKTTRNFLLATQGKAMLQLHGEGDPTGRGEGFSFIKTSMKGGFRAIGESVEDKLDAQRLKELGGHSYNVARQQKSYEESIRRIWEAQKTSLSSTIEHSDEESDIDRDEPDEVFTKPRARSERPTPGLGRRDDETTSQFSRMSTASHTGKVMKITRKVPNSKGGYDEVQEIVKDPRVIKQYVKQRHEAEARNLILGDIKPTGDPETDARRMKQLHLELQRLQRNKERRHARERQKGITSDVASPGGANSPTTAVPKGGGTQRKCANCGQVGHIKTNKKLCPLLNGTMKAEDGLAGSAFAMGAPPAI
ncbi:transcription factor TFIID complex subunit Taf111 [Histoplasma capsulatum G186AR]|uniref:Transcription factor TFIID complex subunit Taf111 n=1 Tax=Ajellomyces capsulatus TaxID=5037 RepID=A0A8H7Z7I9_AJECA|nr:transcription factor TFIID complex subunit Taf111 [Histoplasma capsulatum]QSS71929.1 transcription factor TFIID complex subunit Taf111 [Histoplasma capsulatum G186AR]